MIRKIDAELYPVVCKWWDHYGMPHWPIETQDRGYVAFLGEKPICTCFAFVSDNKFYAYLIMSVMNPESRTEERNQVFKEMIDKLCEDLKSEGVTFMIAPANNPSLIKRYADCGFSIADLDVVHSIKSL